MQQTIQKDITALVIEQQKQFAKKKADQNKILTDAAKVLQAECEEPRPSSHLSGREKSIHDFLYGLLSKCGINLQDWHEAFLIRNSPLFDEKWYVEHYPAAKTEKDPAVHYLKQGWLLGYDSSPWFSTNAYLELYPDVKGNPLLNYLCEGQKKNRTILERRFITAGKIAVDSEFFDPGWYIKKHPEAAGHDAWIHFICEGWLKDFDPSPNFSMKTYRLLNPDVKNVNPFLHYLFIGYAEHRAYQTEEQEAVELLKSSSLFDEKWYLKTYPELADADMDLALHYLKWGYHEGLDPSMFFHSKDYFKLNPDIPETMNPLLHFLCFGCTEKRQIFIDLFQEISNDPSYWTPARQYFGSISIPKNSYESHYEADEDFSSMNTDIKALAFYLPQFHTFPENDHWWGKGFTEWTNTRKARPQYPSHYQPREPHDDIGYYDLSDWHTLQKQAKMLKRHGIYGLCIYHYWFSGKRLMEKPVDLLLEHPEIDLKFCLCWANENWTRAWDGQQDHVLIAQKHENDDIDYIKDLKKYVMDKRYIRVNGAPLILVYRPGILPDAAKTFRSWRQWALKNKIGKIRILVVRGCISTSESAMVEGADGEVEFPPSYTARPTVLKSTEDGVQILSYQGYVDEIVSGRGFTETYKHPVYRGAMLGWDCTPRRKSFHCWYGFSPESYYQWLCYNIKYTRKHHDPEDRFIFINAWNEWAEGTYLEPDKMFGYTNLNTTSRALFDLPLKADIVPEENYSITGNSLYFDEKWYLKTFSDLAEAKIDPLRHFVATGWKEGRSPSEYFPDAVYLFYHPELKSGNDGPLVTFLRNGLPNQYLADMVNQFDDLQASIREKLKIKLAVPTIPESLDDVRDKKIAVHLHCFYTDMIPQICDYLSAIPFAFDLFISVPENQKINLDFREQFRSWLPLLRRCELQICPNRGRDIAPMICTFGEKLLRYDYFCHVHTKKSLHTPAHAKWATFIYEHLFGNRDWMERILHLLATDADMVYPPDFLMMREEPSGWGSNLVFAQKVLDQYGKDIDLEKEFPLIEFPQGSMFWGRTGALKELLELPLSYEDFPEEPLGSDGSIAHALERLFFIWHKDLPGFNYQIFRPGEEDMMSRKRYWFKPMDGNSPKE